jgi:uncharacterized protein (TIGR00725 family)
MNIRKTIIGVMGAGEGATERDLSFAWRLGQLIAQKGWVVLTGGRYAGVMHEASKGAKSVLGSLTVGVLPSESDVVSPHVDLAIFTGMGSARNVINVLSSQVVVVCGSGGPGTASEAALALKVGRPLILLCPSQEAESFFRTLPGILYVTEAPEEVIELIASRLLPTHGGNAA